MAIQLSHGVYATEVCRYSFFDSTSRTNISTHSFVKNEEVWEWDLHSVYNAYIASHENTWNYWIAKANGIYYGLRFSQQNDIITVYEADSAYPSSSSDILFTFTLGSPPTNFKICVLYDYEGSYYTPPKQYQFYMVHNYAKVLFTSVDTLPPNYGGVDAVWGTISPTNRDLINFTITGPVHVTNPNDLVKDESKFVHFTGEQPYFTDSLHNLGFRPYVTDLTNAEGDTPEPVTPPDPSEPPFVPSEDDPYQPTIDDTSDEIPIPGNPNLGVTSAGFVNVYNPGLNALQGLGEILFPDVASATDIVTAVVKLCETLANQNLINYVIDCHVIPVTPVVGTNANIKVGFRTTSISVPKVTNDYVDATCGSLNLAEYYHGYQDYLYTKSRLYLPFIGFVDVKPEFWQAGTISVDYKFNVIDGSFMCYIRSTSSKSQLANTVIAQYGGNACMHIPLTGVNYANMVSGVLGAAAAIATTGGAAGVLGGAASVANTMNQGGNVQQSNGYNSTAALMGVRKPYLMIERPVPSIPSTYPHSKGYPSNIAALLASVSGFTVIEDIDLSGIPLTETELTELRSLLADGVYF